MMERLDQIAENLLSQISKLISQDLTNNGACILAAKSAILQYFNEKVIHGLAPITVQKSLDYQHERTICSLEKAYTDNEWKKTKFESFWEIYNKKVGRTPALKKWMKLKKSDIEQIEATVPYFIATHINSQYRPNPITYINQRRWEDELPQQRQQQINTHKNTWQYDITVDRPTT